MAGCLFGAASLRDRVESSQSNRARRGITRASSLRSDIPHASARLRYGSLAAGECSEMRDGTHQAAAMRP